jgi:microcystin-dependent protein
LGTGGSLDAPYGYWGITRYNYGSTGSQQPLVFSFKQSLNHGEQDKFTIWSGASGPQYPYITGPTGQSDNAIDHFAQRLNVDFLDGAHGTTMPTPFSIPVARASGTIDPGWIDFDNSSIGKCYSVTAHSFVIGDVVRLDPDNLTITGAIATSPENAEVLGIVSRVVNANNFCVTTKGYISGLTGTASSRIASILPLAPGNAYFLSADNVRGMIADPDGGASQLQLGEIRKPLIVALGPDSAYVHNYLGAVFGGIPSGGGAGATGTLSDVVDIQGLMPVGIIQPFSGEIEYIPSGWLLCDGRRLEKSLWTELHTAIGQKFYADGTLNSSYNPNVGGNVPIDIAGWNRGLLVNDAVTVEATVGGVLRESDTFVTSVNGTTVSFDENTFAYETFNGATSFRIRGRLKTPSESYTSVFFIPDLRRRILVGATKGLTGSLTPSISVGDIGGTNQVTLSAANIPPHEHRLTSASINTGLDAEIGVGFGQPTSDSTVDTYFTARGPLGVSTAQPFDNMQEYVTVHWIIRAQKGLSAIILTGHNHDDRYVRYDSSQTVTSSQRNTFRSNAHVLSDGSDGGATFANRLTITGGAVIGDNGSSLLIVRSGASFGGGATFNDVSIVKYPFSSGGLTHKGVISSDNISNYTRWSIRGNPYSEASNGYGDLLVESGWSGSSWNTLSTVIAPMSQAAIKVRGGTIGTSSIAIFNDNALGATNDACSLLMYGKGTASDDVNEVKFSSGIRGRIDRAETSSTITRKFSIVLGGGSSPNAAEDVFTFTRKDSTPATVDINIPKGLATITSPSSYVVLDSNNNLKKVTTVVSAPNIPGASNTLTGAASFDSRHFQIGSTGHVVSKITVNGQIPDSDGNITIDIPTPTTSFGVKAHGSYQLNGSTISTIVSGNLSFSIPTGGQIGRVRCTFTTPMTNTNYTVVVTPLRPANWGSSQIVNSAMGVWQGSKTITHFDLIADSTFSPGPNSSEVVVIG